MYVYAFEIIGRFILNVIRLSYFVLLFCCLTLNSSHSICYIKFLNRTSNRCCVSHSHSFGFSLNSMLFVLFSLINSNWPHRIIIIYTYNILYIHILICIMYCIQFRVPYHFIFCLSLCFSIFSSHILCFTL